MVAGAGAGLAFMGATAAVNHVAAHHRRAEATSLYFVALFLALAVLGIAGGALAQAVGLTGTAVVMLGLAAVIAVVLMDNVTDAFMPDQGPARRVPAGTGPARATATTAEGTAPDVLIAEHGFSMLITVRTGYQEHRLLFDAGTSPDGVMQNMRRLGIDPATIRSGRAVARALRPHSAGRRCRWSCTRTPGASAGPPCPAATRSSCPPRAAARSPRAGSRS